ncbi:MAG: DUF6864 domain-containing function [Dehalococcoidales bacterium]|jgi:hypothetical protein
MSEEQTYLAKTVESGPAEVIDSGTVISFAGSPISLHYPDLGIKIVFEFKVGEEGRGTSVESSVSEPGTLQLNLYNFDDRFGAGTIKPMRIGKYEGRRLYIQLRVYTLQGSPDKTLQYTVYKGEEVSDSDHA